MNKLVIISISYTLLIVYALGYLSIAFFGNYGWLLFLLAPFLLGFAPSFVISNIEPVSKKKSYVLGFTSLFLACLGLVVLGVEGLICILMASPLFIAATFLGILLVDRINIQKINNPRIILLIILAYILSFFTLDYVNDTNQLIPITSSIVIDKPIETIWEVTTNNIEISKPDLFLDKFGIGYPKSITFFNKGVGATRDFNFSTGSYLQSVTAWDAPNLISFETKKSPM
ncbi:hypothetical protein [Ulvibacter litoralis]|uniref:Uncharacterized protein n=1 Tax=Ulvibacter litoralis TaxID=227084 RepID=A0A1G7HKR9_9FLAO|nr:hypothetical protein [Ulvibacter litoralis]GHC58181.1 hypothetical protein GCM10008083_23580 [Ulvibacter litoralis]SDF00916.1 hypothetical protein SAMN05421855_104147 [Ulvibacter litoralis]